MEILWGLLPGWGQETLAWLSSATQWPREAEAVGCRWPGQEGPVREQLWCVKGKLKHTGQTASSE